MRYERAERLIQLALEMQVARGGLTISDIEERFSVSRRTAIRMKDAVLRAFPQASEVQLGDRRKRWRLPVRIAQPLIGVTADDFAILNLAISVFEQQGLPAYAERMKLLGSKVRGLLEPDVIRRIDPDVSALQDAEIFVNCLGSKEKVSSDLLDKLRNSIKSCKKISFNYKLKNVSNIILANPYYIIYGCKNKVGAMIDGESFLQFYDINKISKLAISNESFERSVDCALPNFAPDCFRSCPI